VTDGFKPLPGEGGVRFGCGAVVGALLGFHLAVRETDADASTAVAVIAVAAISLGWLAARYGDRFWEGLINLVRWW
jgi:hypothetical protein